MNGQSVLTVIVLACCCLFFGKGDESIEKARKHLQFHFRQLRPYSKGPHILRNAATVYRHLNEVNDKQRTWQHWLLKYTDYSLEQLKNPPGFFESEDELKLATEYHLWLRAWYYVRFITLQKAAKRHSLPGDRYPRKEICRNAAATALEYSKNHKYLYKQCYQALSEEAKQNIMEELKFPKHITSRDLNHQYAENDVISRVKKHLKNLIKRLLEHKETMKKQTDGLQLAKNQNDAFLIEKEEQKNQLQLENQNLKSNLSKKKEEATYKNDELNKHQSPTTYPSPIIPGQKLATYNVCITYADDLLPRLRLVIDLVRNSLYKALSDIKGLATFNITNHSITELTNAKLADKIDIVLVEAELTANRLRNEDREVYDNLKGKFGNSDGKPDRRYLVLLCADQPAKQNVFPLEDVDGISKDPLAKPNMSIMFKSGMRENEKVYAEKNKATIMHISEWIKNLLVTKGPA